MAQTIYSSLSAYSSNHSIQCDTLISKEIIYSFGFLHVVDLRTHLLVPIYCRSPVHHELNI